MAYGCLAVAAGALLSARLSEPAAAGALYSILLPYAGRIVALTAPQPIVCLGSGAFYLGLLAAVMCRWAEAVGRFQVLALAAAQPTEARRMRAAGLVCLGGGAGLAGSSLRTVRGADVICRSGGVIVHVRFRRPPVAPVQACYH